MNYSTFKKVITLSLLCVFIRTATNAQDASKNSPPGRTWSAGVYGGFLAPITIVGGSNDFTYWDATTGYGLTVRKQLSHIFGLELSGLRGSVEGNNNNNTGPADIAIMQDLNRTRFKTSLDYSAMLSGVATVASILKNSVSFVVKAGYGVDWYAPKVNVSRTFFTAISGQGGFPSNTIDFKGKAGADSTKTYFKAGIISAGAGAKFKISNRLDFDLGYNMYFVNRDNFDGTITGNTRDRYSLIYVGLDFKIK